jgi:hypothetical protein
MRTLAIMCFVWFVLGGSWPWIVGAWILWEVGGGVKIFGSLWVSGKIRDRD